MQGYCVKCKDKQDIKDGKEVTNKKGTLMLKGVCPKCGTTMVRFLPKEPAKAKGKAKR